MSVAVKFSPHLFPFDDRMLHHAISAGAICTLQGDVLRVRVPGSKPPLVVRKRQSVKAYSRGAKFRMLRFVNAVNYSKVHAARFISLTFPDECYSEDVELPCLMRRMIVEIEKWTGQCGMLWRIEWEVRQSGGEVGNLYPHFHIVVFSGRFIPYWEVNKSWKRIIGRIGYCRTETRASKGKRQTVRYVSKYVSKVNDAASLVYSAYQNKPRGRHWGIRRKELIPMCPARACIITSATILKRLRELVRRKYPGLDADESRGFTLLNEECAVIAQAAGVRFTS